MICGDNGLLQILPLPYRPFISTALLVVPGNALILIPVNDGNLVAAFYP